EWVTPCTQILFCAPSHGTRLPPVQLVVVLPQEHTLGILPAGGCANLFGSSAAAFSTSCTALKAFVEGSLAVVQVEQMGAAAARAPSRAACVKVPYMRNACPNQKMPSKIMNIKG